MSKVNNGYRFYEHLVFFMVNDHWLFKDQGFLFTFPDWKNGSKAIKVTFWSTGSHGSWNAANKNSIDGLVSEMFSLDTIFLQPYRILPVKYSFRYRKWYNNNLLVPNDAQSSVFLRPYYELAVLNDLKVELNANL
jgi:hypothetical protein